jgi:hypothetical protein
VQNRVGIATCIPGNSVDRRKLTPDNINETLERRLREAETRTARTQMLIEWQKKVINEMSQQGGADLDVAREVLSTLVDTLHWNETEVAQIKRDLEFINRNTH